MLNHIYSMEVVSDRWLSTASNPVQETVKDGVGYKQNQKVA